MDNKPIISKKLVVVLSVIGFSFVVVFGSIYIINTFGDVISENVDRISPFKKTTSSGFIYKLSNEVNNLDASIQNERKFDQLLREFPELGNNDVKEIEIVFSPDSQQEYTYGWSSGQAWGQSSAQPVNSNKLTITIFLNPNLLKDANWNDSQINRVIEQMLVESIVVYSLTNNHKNPAPLRENYEQRKQEIDELTKKTMEQLEKDAPGWIIQTKLIN